MKEEEIKKYPSYLELLEKELDQKISQLFKILENCQLCPRKCGINRLKGERGFCKIGALPMVSSFHAHFGEEKVLVGRKGSGTIFFTFCNLACVYCQNYEISQLGIGKEISFERLAEMMLKLQRQGCHNINLVTPTPQAPQIVKALKIAKERGLKLPLVYNTNSYDSVKTLKLLEGIIDLYLPDTRYSNDLIAQKYSQAPRYFEIMKKALKEMHRQVGDLEVAKKDLKINDLEIPIGVAIRGLIVRHLVLPKGLSRSEKIFRFLAKEISPFTFVNIMDQYYPCYKAHLYPELSQSLTLVEFQRALNLAKSAGLKRIYF